MRLYLKRRSCDASLFEEVLINSCEASIDASNECFFNLYYEDMKKVLCCIIDLTRGP